MTPGADICRQINLTSDFVDSNGKAEVLGGIFLNRERESHAVGGVAEETGGAGLQVTMSSQTV
jgi:hypothetical protein